MGSGGSEVRGGSLVLPEVTLGPFLVKVTTRNISGRPSLGPHYFPVGMLRHGRAGYPLKPPLLFPAGFRSGSGLLAYIVVALVLGPHFVPVGTPRRGRTSSLLKPSLLFPAGFRSGSGLRANVKLETHEALHAVFRPAVTGGVASGSSGLLLTSL